MFESIGHILALVGRQLHRLVDLLPLDHLDRIALLLEERGEAVAKESVGDVLRTGQDVIRPAPSAREA